MFDDTEVGRRQFLGAAGVTLAAMHLRTSNDQGAARPEEPHMPGSSSRSTQWLDTVKQVDAGLLNVGYADVGPPTGPVVLLLHGWPYDIQSYADVVPLLTAKGYRVIVPYL